MSFANILASEANKTTTENGCVSYESTGTALVDFFYQAPVIMNDDKKLIRLFEAAFDEDPVLAIACLFWIRDARGGAGRRQTFRTIYNAFINSPKVKPYMLSCLNLIPEYGRWDDLWKCGAMENDNEEAINLVTYLINCGLNDPKTSSLVAKWLPRERGKNKSLAYTLMTLLDMKPKAYRKLCSNLCKEVVEVKQSAKKWNEIVFEHVPSIAMLRYKNAFERNCRERFEEYKRALEEGKTKINASVLYPYQVVKAANNYESSLADQQWKALPDYVPEGLSFLPVVDVSGSMTISVGSGTTALDVAVSLGLYLAERNKSVFKDVFVTFSHKPQFVKIKGKTLYEKLLSIRRSDWEMNTNIEAVFDKLLELAVKNKVPQEELPSVVLIMSDMQFDECTTDASMTFMESVNEKFENAGYECPVLAFWNLNSRYGDIPTQADEPGVRLLSGFSPSLMKNILAGKNVTPYQQILEVLASQRYEPVFKAINDCLG